MAEDRFHIVMRVFKEACQLDGPARAAFLDDQCRDDAGLRHQVEEMLAADAGAGPVDRAGGGMEALAHGIAARETSSPNVIQSLPDERVAILAGQYKILRVVGEGGMGTVYEAEQSFPRRIVALKAIRRGLVSRQTLRRFENEAQILARLHHPGIAQIYEAGAPDKKNADQAYIAMEFVRGLPLTRHAAERQLSIPQRLELVARVAEAVHHAHLRGIIHRDLKPNNILVVDEPADSVAGDRSARNGVGRPKVLDFGVARATGTDREFHTMHTVSGQILGTLPYMSPEQLGGDPDEVDARADVYAIGLMLYELLTGRLPHDVSNQPLAEAVRLIREGAVEPLARTNRAFRGDVETIVARAIEKDRERRYASAADLAEDLRRHLRGEPIAARRDSTMYVLGRSLRRYRGVLAAAALLITVLVVFGVRSFVQARENKHLAAEALAQKRRADDEAVKLRRTLYLNRIGFAQAALENQNSDRFLRLLDACPPELRGWEWQYLRRLSDRSASTTRAPAMIVSLAASADGRRYLLHHPKGVIEAFDAGAPAPVLTIRDAGAVTRLDISSDGTRLVISDNMGRVSVRDADSGDVQLEWRVDIPEGRTGVPDVKFSRDGRIIAVGALDGPISLHDAETGALIRRLAGHTNCVTAMGFLADGRRLASGSLDATVRVWELADGSCTQLFATHSLPIRALAVHPTRPLVLSGGADGLVKEWQADTGKLVRGSRPHEGGVLAVAYSPDGSCLVSSGADFTIYVQDGTQPRAFIRLTGHTANVTALAFVGTPTTLLSGSQNGELKRWDWPIRPEPSVVDCAQVNVSAMALSPDGRWLVTGGGKGAVKMWDAESLEQRFEVAGNGRMIQRVAWFPDGRSFIAAGLDPVIHRRDARTGDVLLEIGGISRLLYDAAVSPDGRWIAAADGSGMIRVFDAANGAELHSLQAHAVDARAVAFHPRGAFLLSAGRDGVVKAWDLSTWTLLRETKCHDDAILHILFSPDGTRFATASADATAAVWDAETGRRISQCRGHIGFVRCLEFDSGGARLVTGGMDRTIRVWDPLGGEEFVTLRGHGSHVDALAFSRDGQRLYSGSGDDTVRVWSGVGGPVAQHEEASPQG